MPPRPLRLALYLVSALALGNSAAPAAAANAAPTAALRATDRGVICPLTGGLLELQVWADDIIRVTFSSAADFSAHPSLMIEPRSRPAVPWTLAQDDRTATLKTAKLQARLDRVTGAVTFLDAAGRTILAEQPAGRSLTPAEVQGEKTFHVRQQWDSPAGESLYGLGQRQLGILDLKGYDLDLWQRNTHVVVPFLVSSAGYGLLWDNNSFSRFGDLRDFVPVPADRLRDASGQPDGLTTGTFTAAAPDTLENSRVTDDLTRPAGDSRANFRWAGELAPDESGDYQLQTYANGGIKVWLDGKLVIDRWRQNWLTEYDQVKLHLDAGRRYAVRIESGGDQTSTMRFRWKTPSRETGTSLWSEVGDGIDYYFVSGPSLDQVVAGYRNLTGQASLMPRWAFGLWQSRQRYETAQQSLDVVAEYRRRGLPFDTIVQDWMYWPENAWGSHAFDPVRFPDPDAWIKSIHEQHAHLMISVWGKFYSGDYPGSENFHAMQRAGYLYTPTLTAGTRDWVGRGGYNYAFYDAFNAGARKLFWEQVSPALFRRGVDAWWMDATEPDVVQPSPATLETMRQFIGQTALGTASRVMNAYALENSRAVYEGQRAEKPDQRVFILTRSGFAGIQRYATATWSGDITSTWTAFEKQIPAVLGYSLSGVPYWTMDIGGYTMPSRFSARRQTPEAAEEWRELNARWFEFGAFCPLTRLHGEQQPREPWTFGGDTHPAYQAIVKFDRLRYRLLPYIYSLADATTHDGGTIMRPLVMDFPRDPGSRDVTDEYLFGPAFLVAPVTKYQARSRPIYLPPTTGGWFDFWSGRALTGSQTIDAPAPYDAMPLHIRAGSIIPFGPELHYVDEKPADPVTLFIYAGADGAFSLYEDDGTTYAYERGEFARIPLRWDNATRTLFLGRRTGRFPGMLAGRTFDLVLVTPDRPVPFTFTPKADRTVRYVGDATKIVLP